jgi:hypothetical protein
MADQQTTARTFKEATTNKPNKTKSNHMQPKDTNKTDGNLHNHNNQRQL